MNESGWLKATDPRDIFAYLDWRRSPENQTQPTGAEGSIGVWDRKLQLYACAGFRLSFPHLVYVVDRLAVEAAERFADDLISEAEFIVAKGRCGLAASRTCSQPAIEAAKHAPGGLRIRLNHPAGSQQPVSGVVSCDLLRCIFGNPFRPIVFADSWRSETAVALASAIYAERAFDRLPILADALEEAGCDHADVLSHCRGSGPHARGCWVVDRVLGKS